VVPAAPETLLLELLDQAWPVETLRVPVVVLVVEVVPDTSVVAVEVHAAVPAAVAHRKLLA
jgi:hypothetical protein